MGIHPTLVRTVNDSTLYQLETLLCDPRVSGISELGMDHSAPEGTWAKQEQLLTRILQMGVAGRVLVINVRGKLATEKEELAPYGHESLDIIVDQKQKRQMHWRTQQERLQSRSKRESSERGIQLSLYSFL